MQAGASSYLFIFRESTPERYDAMSPEERRQALERWNAWCDELAEQGKLQDGQTLAPAARVVSATGRAHAVDGPFAETKELIAGYFLLTAESFDEATAIAEQCPNLPHGMVVEVRPVAQACHLARSLGRDTMRGAEAQRVNR